MNYEEFKLQLETMNKELFSSFQEAKEQREQTGEKIIQTLSETYSSNQIDLNSLDEEFLKVCEKQRKAIEKYQNQINKLKDELQTGLTLYDENFSLTREEEKLVAQKKRTMLPTRQVYRKELHDIQAKVDRIEKERDQILKEKEDLFEEEQKNFKTKMAELDKRNYFDVKRINDNTSKEYKDLEMTLSQENNRREIKRIQKSIKEIRRTGTIEAKKVSLSYLDEEKEAELAFFRFSKNYEKEISVIKDEYQIKLEELDLEKKYCDHNFHMEEDKYDFGTKRAIHNISQNAQKKRVDLLCSYHDQIQTLNQEMYDKKIEQLNQKLDVSKKVLQSSYDKDFGQNQNILTISSSDSESLQEEIKKYQEYFVSLFAQFEQIILLICSDYLDEMKKQEEEALKYFSIFSYQTTAFQGYQYQKYIDKFNDISIKIQEIQNSSFQDFTNEIHNQVALLKQQFDNTIQNIILFVKKSLAHRLAYRQNIEQILQDAKDMGIRFNEQLLENEKQKIEEERNKCKSDYDLEKQEEKETRIKIDEEYQANESQLNDKIKVHQNENDALKETYRLQCEENKNQLVLHIKETEEQLKNILLVGEKEIVDKYISLKSNVEKEYKNKIDLL